MAAMRCFAYREHINCAAKPAPKNLALQLRLARTESPAWHLWNPVSLASLVSWASSACSPSLPVRSLPDVASSCCPKLLIPLGLEVQVARAFEDSLGPESRDHSLPAAGGTAPAPRLPHLKPGALHLKAVKECV